MYHCHTLHHTNSIQNIFSESLKIIGPIIGIIVYKYIGFTGALLINALSFYLAALNEYRFININSSNNILKEKQKINIIGEFLEGFKYIKTEKQILNSLIIIALLNFILAGFNLILPYIYKLHNSRFLDTNTYGLILTIEAIGGILGGYIYSKFDKRLQELNINVLLILIGISVFCIWGSFKVYLYLMYVGFFFIGFSLSIFNISFFSNIQINTNNKYLGRVFSVIFTLASVLMPIGNFTFNLLIDIYKLDTFLIISLLLFMLSILNYALNKINLV
ncbi:MFS transporter [Macrococcus psychrotolerans]